MLTTLRLSLISRSYVSVAPYSTSACILIYKFAPKAFRLRT